MMMSGPLLAWIQKLEVQHLRGFKSIKQTYNIHVCFPIIACNEELFQFSSAKCLQFTASVMFFLVCIHFQS